MKEPEDERPAPPPDDAAGPTGPLADDVPPPAGFARAPGPSSFAAGELLGGRYRVVRFIARGGMGEVYEAEDLELGERIAIKTLRRESAQDARGTDRMRREILLARKVTHPNVCRIFDVSRQGETAFLTMELLAGETLAERLQRGRMEAGEALPVAAQVAAALGAAHRAGIVHRDFKSANVMLVPARDAAAGTRAVVTDFGLARAVDTREPLSTSITGTGFVVGTSAYMAPEQVQDGTIGPAADIYALGIVLYEMVTGRLPFVGNSALATAAKRLTEPPAPPRVHVPALDPRWEATILRCLALRPPDRFAAAEDVARALGGERVGPARGRRPTLAAGAIAAVLVATGAAWLGLRGGAPPEPAPGAPPAVSPPASGPAAPAPAPPRRSVAVIGFRNLSGRPESAWISSALSEMLGMELAAGEAIRLVPGENVSRMRVELSLPEAESLGVDTLERIRANLGTDFVALGSYLDLGGRLRVDVRLQDAARGETVAAVSETGTKDGLFDLVGRAGARLRAVLGAPSLSTEDAGRVRAVIPSSPEAARLYSEGLARLRGFDALEARRRLEKAASAAPQHPLVHAALAEALSSLGDDPRAQQEARRALELASGLSRELRLSVEGRYHDAAREWDEAAEVYRTLFGFYPDNVEYGLKLAAAQTAAGKGQDALATVGSLRRLPPPASEDPRIDLEEAAAAAALSQYRRSEAAAERAIAKGKARGTSLLVARGRVWQGWALWDLGDPRRALEAYEEARRIYQAAGDRSGVARSLRGLGTVVSAQGDLDRARQLFDESLAVYREIGNAAGAAMALTNVGNVLYKQGDLAGARKAFEQSLPLRREAGDTPGIASPLANIAMILRDQGDLAGARRLFEEVLAIKRKVGEGTGISVALNSSGEVLLAQGDLAGARERHQESLAICRSAGSRRAEAYALYDLGQVLLAQGELTGARARHQEALEIRGQLGEQGNAALSRLALAGVGFEEGAPPEQVAAVAREAAREFGEEGRAVPEAQASLLLARALLALGQAGPAGEALARARALLARTPSREASLSLALAAARLAAASGQADRAAQDLAAAIRDAEKEGFRGVALEARFALAGIEQASGRAGAARERLEKLAKDAAAQGFGLLARKAEARAR